MTSALPPQPPTYAPVVRPKRRLVAKVSGWALIVAGAATAAPYLWILVQLIAGGFKGFPDGIAWFIWSFTTCIPIAFIFCAARAGYRNRGLIGMAAAGVAVAAVTGAIGGLIILWVTLMILGVFQLLLHWLGA